MTLDGEPTIRAKVGYGGGDFTVANGVAYMVSAAGTIYRQSLRGGAAQAITPAFGYAAAPVVAPDGRKVLYVHTYQGEDALVVADTSGGQFPQRLVRGHDFFMHPRWHPNGNALVYLAWDHPLMPWDGTTLYFATLREDAAGLVITDTQVIAGGTTTAIFQPEFSPDGRWLAYISDESGWAHIHLYDVHHHTTQQLTQGAAEYGIPAWAQGMRTYAWCADSDALVVIRNEHGFATLHYLPLDGSQAIPIRGVEQYTWFEQPTLAPGRDALAVIASSSTLSPRLVLVTGLPQTATTATTATTTTATLAWSEPVSLQPSSSSVLAEPQSLTWQTADGSTVYGLLYRPHMTADIPGLPPAIVKVHGGPTGQAVAKYAPEVQFFTTRGYVVLLVNYRGSTGYGRDYKNMLYGNWGVTDVEDTVSGARHLAAQGIADEHKLVIMGSSSGGYTVLETLCRAPGVFKAGICLYGVSNLFDLVADTHKFEERYVDTLIGSLPAASATYRERSPLFHADLINDPVALFQGTDDQIVPRAQSDRIAESLRKRGVPHVYHVYEGEGHGWRKPETIESYYAALEQFLRQYVIFT
jgi:dipeptidyl aminopeptidase/acylaminoacyl peptidase